MAVMSALDIEIRNKCKTDADYEYCSQEIAELINGWLHWEDASTKSLDIIRQFEHDEQTTLINWEPKVREDVPNYAEYPDHEDMRRAK